MGLYSDFLHPEKHRDGISDRNAIIFALVSVVVIVTVLIGGSGLLMRMFY
jgi:hypothetical protein